MLNLRSAFSSRLATLVVGCTSLAILSGFASPALAAKAPGCKPPALTPFYFAFGSVSSQPRHEVPGTRITGLLNPSSKPVSAVITLTQQTMKGFSVSSSIGAEAGPVFAKIKTQIDSTLSQTVTSGAAIPMKITVPSHKRPYVYWAMPTRSVSYHTYTVFTDCTVDRDYGSWTATWLTGSTVLPYVGFLSY
jgi:hypothetical protein